MCVEVSEAFFPDYKGIHVSIFFAKFPTYEIIFRGLRNFRRQARTEKSADAHNKISEVSVNISRWSRFMLYDD